MSKAIDYLRIRQKVYQDKTPYTYAYVNRKMREVSNQSITVTLTVEECKALYTLIDELSGGGASNVFAYGGADDPDNPTVSACVKVYSKAGRMHAIPIDLLEHFRGQ